MTVDSDILTNQNQCKRNQITIRFRAWTASYSDFFFIYFCLFHSLALMLALVPTKPSLSKQPRDMVSSFPF